MNRNCNQRAQISWSLWSEMSWNKKYWWTTPNSSKLYRISWKLMSTMLIKIFWWKQTPISRTCWKNNLVRVHLLRWCVWLSW